MPEAPLEMINTIGINAFTLLSCFWYIRFLNQSFNDERVKAQEERDRIRAEAAEERKRFDEKDTAADIRILELQKSSYQSLMTIMQETAKVLQDLHTSINELKVLLHQDRAKWNRFSQAWLCCFQRQLSHCLLSIKLCTSFHGLISVPCDLLPLIKCKAWPVISPCNPPFSFAVVWLTTTERTIDM